MSKLSRAIAVMKKYQKRKSYDDLTTIEKLIVVMHAQAKSPDHFVSAMSTLIGSVRPRRRDNQGKGEGV